MQSDQEAYSGEAERAGRPLGRRQILAGLALLAITGCAGPSRKPTAATSETSPHWDYEAEGPEHWAELDSRYLTCGTGHAQSPVDLSSHTQLHPDDHITIEYGIVPAFGILHDGHTLLVRPAAADSSRILLGGRPFQLTQFHFHMPSEHTVDGVNSTMELHLVHRDDSGSLAVLGILMQETAGASGFDPLLATVPQRQGESVLTGPIDLRTLLPADLGQFRYEGSLTTPPCSEGVSWTVLRNPVPVSREVADRYHALFPHSNRPTQPLNGRTVIIAGG
ncbi:carbonic anhydrase [Nocardia sp. NPDC127526]|uniref:carbonic anhydrase n=1 Tax=Nocardia sp. NPDC127526 TaxID=3345393 RepID=UPI0036332940